MKSSPITKRILAAIVLLLFTGGAAFVIWGSTPPSPMPEALAGMQSNQQVNVSQEGNWTIFRPVNHNPQIGLIFYPGGRVDYRSYAHLLQQISGTGYLVVLVRMPLNLAVLNLDAAQEVLLDFPEIDSWALGGHSLGGAMAAQYVAQKPDHIQGLILWASYPANSTDLSAFDLEVMSIFATRDGLSSLDKIENSRSLLPPDTVWVSIEGGNHAQFGSYGEQRGDMVPTISAQEQQRQIVQATVDLLGVLAGIPLLPE